MDYKLKHSLKRLIAFMLSLITFFNILSVYPQTVHGENSTQIIEEEIIEEKIIEEEIIEEEKVIVDEIISEDIPYENLIQKTNAEEYISVYTAEDLKNIKNNLSGNYSLENDIDLEGEEWTPIGTSQNPFFGIFNGNNHTIRNFKIESESDNIGFFGFINTSEIKNLILENITVSGKNYIGTLIGRSKNSKVSNVHIKNSVVTGSSNVGGLAGFVEATEVEKTSVTGEGLITGNISIGGAIGYMTDKSKLNESFSKINVKGSSSYVGGLVGTLYSSSEIRNCYSSSSVYGSSSYMAGILGHGYAGSNIVENTLFTGKVSNNIGVFSGYSSTYTVIENSYFDRDTVVSTKPIDQAKSFDELTQEKTFIDWDFENIWEIEEGKDYPTLKSISEHGVESAYIEVSTKEELKQIAKLPSDYNKYVLTADIDLEGEEWTPIGTSQNPFFGMFDGNNHTIRNFKIESESDNIGFFGFINTSEIKNLILENITVSGKNYIGTLIGRSKSSKVSNVHIKNSAVTGSSNVGGLAGFVEATEVEKTSVTGEGSITGNSNIGGTIGYMTDKSKLNESFSKINVKGSSSYVGGLVGTLYSSSEIRNCYSSSSVYGSSSYMAGILGHGYAGSNIVENTLFTGKVSNNIGVFSGYSSTYTVIENSYFDRDTVVSTKPIDQAKSFDELTQEKTFIDWDFENIWEIEEGKYYPTLKSISEHGVESAYIEVSTKEELKQIAKLPSDYNKYVLTADIDLEGEEWTPIGTSQNPFFGMFDGNNHTIRNFKIESESDNIGFFGFINTSEIKNLILENITVSGKNYIGTLIGRSKSSKVSNVHIKNSAVTGSSNVGGLAGFVEATEVEKTSVTGEGSITGNSNIGGTIGYMTDKSKLNESFSKINVKGSSSYVGGLVGTLYSSSEIRNCYSSSSVYGSSSYMAGILGHGYAGSNIVENTLFTGKVSNNIGVFSGYSSTYTVIENSYFDRDTVVSTKPIDQAKSFDELTQEKTFIDWDFENIWEIEEGKYYPTLKSISEHGVESAYIEVSTKEELKQIAKLPSDYNKYVLTADIDLEGEEWTPIGTSQNPFFGMFDGNNHTIRNFKIESESDNIGFFGFINTSEIKNLILENITVSGKNYIGTLIGRSKSSKVSNVHIKNSAVTGSSNVGGLAGFVEATEVEKTSVTGEGLITGNISIGGAIGYMTDKSKLNESFSKINVKGSSSYVGGLVGTLYSSSEIRNCYSSSSVYGSSSYMAGILGHGYAGSNIVENTLFTGKVSNNIGVFSGYSSTYTVIENSYFDRDTVVSTKPINQAKSFDELTQEKTFIDWDFGNIWGIEEGKTYPYLLNNLEIEAYGPIKGILSPTFLKISGDNSIFGEIIEGTGKIDLEIIIEDGFTWKIFKDEKLTTEISKKDIPLLYDKNTFYIEATNGDEIFIYPLRIVRFSETILPIENLTSEGLDNKISLTWDLLESTLIKGYKVFRSTSEDSGFSEIANNKGRGYIYYDDKNIKPLTTYYYKVVAFNQIGTLGLIKDAAIVSGMIRDTEAPRAKAGFNFDASVNEEVSFNGSASTDNVEIKSYEWDLGDGTTSAEKNLTHTYKEVGIKNVTLKVTDTSGNTGLDTIKVSVRPENQTGKLVLTLLDEKTNSPLANAMIYLDHPDEPLHYVTNSQGEVVIYTDPGSYNIAGYKKGYLPKQENIEVKQYTTSTFTLKLKKEEIVIGDIISRPLDIDEIIELGIDPNDPDNSHVYEFEINLEFDGTITKEKIISSGNNKPIWIPEYGTYYPEVVPVPGHPEIPPTVILLKVPNNSIKFLKEFFEVSVYVQNNAPEDFVIKDNKLKLNLPEGLSLAKTSEGQELEIELDDLYGGGFFRSASWIVRGDVPGSYDIEATYLGLLMPFKALLKSTFKTAEPMVVSDMENITLFLNPDSIAKSGDAYYIDYSFVNFSNRPLYNLELKLGNGKNRNLDQKTTLIYTDPITQVSYEMPLGPLTPNKYKIDKVSKSGLIPDLEDGDSIFIDVLYSGESLNGSFSTKFNATSKDDLIYYLENASIEGGSGSSKINVEFGFLKDGFTPRDSSTPINSRNINGMDQQGYMHNAVTIMDFNNYVYIPFQMEYMSSYRRPNLKDIENKEDEKETSGWSTNFDFKIKQMEDGSLGVYYSDTEYVKFRNRNVNDRIIHGELKEGSNENIITVGDSLETGEYRSNTVGYKRYVLNKDSDGTYSLTDDKKNNYLFDNDGKLSKTTDRKGKTLNINETKEKKVITEESSGQKITTYYDEHGNISNVSDEFGNTAAFTYNSSGMLSSITDVEGKTTEYEYDPNNRLSKIKDRQGDVISYEYDKYGRTTKETDASGNYTSYQYDEHENMWSILVTNTDRNGNVTRTKVDKAGQVVSTEDSFGNKTLYTYNEDGDLISEIDPNKSAVIYSYNEYGDLTKVIDREGTEQLMTYDTNGNLLTSKLLNGSQLEYKYNDKNWLVESENERGVVTNFEYNDNGQIIKKTVADFGVINYTYENGNLITQSDFKNNLIKYEYNEKGKLTGITDKEGNKYSYVVDKKGRVLESTSPNGCKTINTYDDRGNLLTSNEEGNITTYSYDLNNRLLNISNPLEEKAVFNYDKNGNLILGTNPDEGTFKYFYDSNNNLIKQTDPNNGEVTFGYNNKNELIKNTDPNGGEVIYDYYKNGLIKSETDQNKNTTKYFYNRVNNLSKIENAAGNATYFEYDKSGNLTKVIDGLGNESISVYDEYSRLVKEKNALGNEVTYKYNVNSELEESTDYLGYKTLMSYTKNGLLETETNPLGGVTKLSYDSMGHVLSVTNPLGHTVSGTYDKFGNLTSLIDALKTTVQTIKYDRLNRPIESKDGLGNTATTSYNEISEVIQKTNELNNTTNFSYDKLGNLLTSANPEGAEVKFTYDLMNNMTSFTDGNGNVTEVEYDLAGRVLKEKMSIGSEKTYSYNSLNLLTEVINARGMSINYKYDNANRLTNIAEINAVYDNLGNLLTIENSEGITTRTYDKNNQVISFKDTNGDEIKYLYDPLGNIIEIAYPTGEIIKYTYNLASQLETVIDYKGRETKYFYNPNGQLIQTVNANGTIENLEYNELYQTTKKEVITSNYRFAYTYEYDEVGNLTSEKKPDFEIENPIIESFLINKEITYTNGNKISTYNGESVYYDLDGNLTHGPLENEMVDFKYDKFNQLVEVDDTKYFYNGEGTRTKQSWNNEKSYLEYVTNPLGSLGSVISSKNELGEIILYVYGLGLISQEKKESFDLSYSNYRVFIFDSRGSTIGLTNEFGNIIDTFSYGPYGELEKRTGATKTIFLYVGKFGVEKDNNGLSYMRARYYNPDTQSFVNLDPIKDGLNWYGYTSGNPINFIDPTGYRVVEDETTFRELRGVFPYEGVPTRWIPQVMQLNGSTNQQKYLTQRLSKFNQLGWDQSKVNEIWNASEHIYKEYNIQIDPRFLLSIIIQEGTGSFNTSSSNLASDGQHGVESDYTVDLMKANNLVFGKTLGYIYYGEEFEKAVYANKNLPGLENNPNIFQYMNWETPIIRMNSGNFDIGGYAGHGDWHSGVQGIYEKLSYTGAANRYSNYLSGINPAIAIEIAGKAGINFPNVNFTASQNAQNSAGDINHKYTVVGKKVK